MSKKQEQHKGYVCTAPYQESARAWVSQNHRITARPDIAHLPRYDFIRSLERFYGEDNYSESGVIQNSQ